MMWLNIQRNVYITQYLQINFPTLFQVNAFYPLVCHFLRYKLLIPFSRLLQTHLYTLAVYLNSLNLLNKVFHLDEV